MARAASLPLFHLYGDPPDDQAFDFIHIETIASRSAVHDWTIRAHRHRNLFQILLIEQGGGEMTYEAAITPFAAPAIIAVPPTVAHGFRFQPLATDGWVVSFTEDVADAIGARSGEGAAWLKALAAEPMVPLATAGAGERLARLCADLMEEGFLGREGYRIAMRGLLALNQKQTARAAAQFAQAEKLGGDSPDLRIEYAMTLYASAQNALSPWRIRWRAVARGPSMPRLRSLTRLSVRSPPSTRQLTSR